MAPKTIPLSYHEIWLRAMFGLVFVSLVLILVPACGHPKSPSTPPVTLIITGSSAEPVPSLPDSVRSVLTDHAHQAKKPGDAVVQLISSASGPIVSKDLTPLRGNGDVQHAPVAADRQIQHAVDQVATEVAGTTATSPGLDLLPLLDRASTVPSSRIDVISSGVSTENPIDLRQLGWSFTPDRIIDSIARQGELPDLSGDHLTFHSLGITAGSQPRLPSHFRSTIEQFWLRLCQRAKAASCVVAHDDIATASPSALLPVPVVPIPASETEGSCPVWSSLGDDVLHFPPNSAVLPVEADGVLQPVVASIQRCNLVVDIAGFIADTGSGGDANNLSGQRAHAVADRLLSLGLSPNQLGNVVGHGTADPVISNFTGSVFDEAKATLNRRVELAFHHGS